MPAPTLILPLILCWYRPAVRPAGRQQVRGGLGLSVGPPQHDEPRAANRALPSCGILAKRLSIGPERHGAQLHVVVSSCGMANPKESFAAVRKLLRGTPNRGLTIVHGSRHSPGEFGLHAEFFNDCNTSWLVQSSDLLLATNNMSHSASDLRSALRSYPHRNRALARMAQNSGRRCGHLEAIQVLEPVWRDYRFVLFLHPDVYLLPDAFKQLSSAMQAHEGVPFIVTAFGYKRQSRAEWTALRMYNTDIFAFTPAKLSVSSQPLGGGHGDSGGGSTGLWTQACTANTEEAPERSLYSIANTVQRHSLQEDGAAGRSGQRMGYPERSSNRSEPLVVGPLRWAGNRRPDALGVWHTHELASVQQYLARRSDLHRRLRLRQCWLQDHGLAAAVAAG